MYGSQAWVDWLPYNCLLFSCFSNVYHFTCVWPTALKLGCIANFDMLFLVMGFISLVDEIQFLLYMLWHLAFKPETNESAINKCFSKQPINKQFLLYMLYGSSFSIPIGICVQKEVKEEINHPVLSLQSFSALQFGFEHLGGLLTGGPKVVVSVSVFFILHCLQRVIT